MPFTKSEVWQPLDSRHLPGRSHWSAGTGQRSDAFGWPDGHAGQVARAVAVLRADFAQALPVDRLATVASMSPSSFHQHFNSLTSMSPLQFQKRFRLIEARRLMFSEALAAGSAAFAVGYESVPQFTRDYGRMFDLPPVRDTAETRGRTVCPSKTAS